jgi:hypothetical protein
LEGVVSLAGDFLFEDFGVSFFFEVGVEAAASFSEVALLGVDFLFETGVLAFEDFGADFVEVGVAAADFAFLEDALFGVLTSYNRLDRVDAHNLPLLLG